MARRAVKERRSFFLLTLIPLFGALAYLCIRPTFTRNRLIAEVCLQVFETIIPRCLLP